MRIRLAAVAVVVVAATSTAQAQDRKCTRCGEMKPANGKWFRDPTRVDGPPICEECAEKLAPHCSQCNKLLNGFYHEVGFSGPGRGTLVCNDCWPAYQEKMRHPAAPAPPATPPPAVEPPKAEGRGSARTIIIAVTAVLIAGIVGLLAYDRFTNKGDA